MFSIMIVDNVVQDHPLLPLSAGHHGVGITVEAHGVGRHSCCGRFSGSCEWEKNPWITKPKTRFC